MREYIEGLSQRRQMVLNDAQPAVSSRSDFQKQLLKPLSPVCYLHAENNPTVLQDMPLSVLVEQADMIGYQRPVNWRDHLHFAACGEDQILPLVPDLPADLFTRHFTKNERQLNRNDLFSCLTTPIRTALHCYLVRNRNVHESLPVEVLDRIPGKVHYFASFK